MRFLVLLPFVGFGLVGCLSVREHPKPVPSSGAEHPFFTTVTGVEIDSGSGGVSRPAPAIEDFAAIRFRTIRAEARIGAARWPVTLEATPEVPAAAMRYLAENLGAIQVDLRRRPDLKSFLSERGKLMRGQPEVRLPQFVDPNGGAILVTWPDGWDMVRPYVIRLRPDYLSMVTVGDQDEDLGVITPALIGDWLGVRGVLHCQAPGEAAQPLAFVGAEINGVRTNADASGAFAVPGVFRVVDQMTVHYDGRVTPAAGVATGPRISVMNDFHNPRRQHVDIAAGEAVDGVLDIGVLVLDSLDCELFEIGAGVLGEFHQITSRDPPAADDFRIKRWSGVDVGTPHTYYDYVAIANNFRRDYTSRFARRNTLFHEFGHTIRHAADGDLGHWGWDNFRWAYARNHAGTEVFNEHYAFNEGWAQYWECTQADWHGECPIMPAGVPGTDFLDWNEMRVGEHLLAMSRATGVGHAAMFDLQASSPGSIHTLWEFENRYCERFDAVPFCSGSRPVRAKASCPPGFNDDGATCRQINILAKDSYGRGVGAVPTACWSEEYDAGLCYQPCAAGFDGVGPVCWRNCPEGMHDDGAFCRRDVWITGSDNSRCPWYDVCGLTFSRGCSICPAGFQNDGCTCRIDAWIFAKDSYGRGVGTIPTDCGPGRVYDAGLCYPPCAPGFSGVGPVCWGRCPEGFADHGATCYRDPNILVKY